MEFLAASILRPAPASWRRARAELELLSGQLRSCYEDHFQVSVFQVKPVAGFVMFLRPDL